MDKTDSTLRLDEDIEEPIYYDFPDIGEFYPLYPETEQAA